MDIRESPYSHVWKKHWARCSTLPSTIARGCWFGLHCAHRATTALSWGLCEHRDHTSRLAIPFPNHALREHSYNAPSKLAPYRPEVVRPGRSSIARVQRLLMLPPSSLVLSQGWGLIDLLLRASNEGLLRPRVARARKIIRLHPLRCSASRRMTRPHYRNPSPPVPPPNPPKFPPKPPCPVPQYSPF